MFVFVLVLLCYDLNSIKFGDNEPEAVSLNTKQETKINNMKERWCRYYYFDIILKTRYVGRKVSNVQLLCALLISSL